MTQQTQTGPSYAALVGAWVEIRRIMARREAEKAAQGAQEKVGG